MVEKTQDIAFYNAQDGMRGRHDSTYLDFEERLEAEKRRAKTENREPNLDNPPPTVGTALVTSAALTDNLNSNPSMRGTEITDEQGRIAADPVGVYPVDRRVDSDLTDEERDAQIRDDDGNVVSDVALNAESPGARPVENPILAGDQERNENSSATLTVDPRTGLAVATHPEVDVEDEDEDETDNV